VGTRLPQQLLFAVRSLLRFRPSLYESRVSMVYRVILILFFVFGALFSSAQEHSAVEQGHVRAEMHNVLYHFTDSISVHISQLEGELVSTQANGLPIFDDPNSFTLVIQSARISVNTDALANVLNQYAFSAADAPLKGIRVTTQGNKIKIRGRLHSKGDVPFESEGSLSVTPQGEIRVHTEKIKAAHVPVKGLMDLLGETISKLIDTRKVRGVRVQGDDLLLAPSEVFPPPHIEGRLSSIVIQGNEIVQEYGSSSRPWANVSGNYMAYRGAQLRFGKLTMSNTDLILLDLDPQDPFDFYLDHYQDQLVAGYTKITHSFGLRTYFRDHNKLTRKQKSQ
jgi:hypothetical protein